MFGFGRKKRQDKNTADTFVEAAGGGWGVPKSIRVDGGSNPDYVMDVLVAAQAKAQEVEVGQRFYFDLTDIPVGIASPHEIIVGIMMNAGNYGLWLESTHNESLRFSRIA